ncbi:MerR family transcriptional regulator [Kutzneria kofuensis]|uniref:DNA-binding transcriptional MerR regulator n=1 Tax=Kutzneria kofuensis TaxID=103725 RepID=A0A7W9NDR0_9PSEU|nr:MerR family transcriptional regulator [Kutzneria kofuensis]MBB5889507.1 DNA-binding transcriptional MerR regulator [Kutzneria kofuensis]
MLVHEVAALLGVSTDTVRYYEREGLLDDRHVARRPNGYRDFDDAAVERLRLLLQARRSGMSIADVKALAATFDDGTLTVDRQLEFLREKLADLDRQAEKLDATRTTIAAKIADLESRLKPATRHERSS